MSIKSDIKTTVKNSFSLVTSVASAGTGIACELSAVAVSGTGAVVPTLKALWKAPVSAYAGYLQEDGNISREEADAKAAAIFDKPAAQLVTDAARLTGKVTASMLKELEEA